MSQRDVGGGFGTRGSRNNDRRKSSTTFRVRNCGPWQDQPKGRTRSDRSVDACHGPVTDTVDVAHPEAVPAASTTSAERITNLDTVRGVATLAILVMNAVSFALPEAAYFNLDAGGGDGWLDRAIGIAGEVFVDQKSMALFSLLFGAGIVLFADRVEARQGRPVALSLWRNLLLLAVGVLHTLLWEGDILTVYAICAPVLLALRKRSPRFLLFTGASMVVASAVAAVLTQATVDDAGTDLGSFWLAGGGSIADGPGLFLIADFFLRALGMMLIGVALHRTNWVQGTRPRADYLRMALLGLGIGLPLSIFGVVVNEANGWEPDLALAGLAPNTLATVPMALGYLAVLSLWNQRTEIGAHRRLRAVGQMALTNYLAHTVLGLLVFDVVFADTSPTRTGVAAFIVAVWALQLWWSQRWLAHFRFGPVEWAWRTATHRRRQPLRRTAA